VTSGGPPQAEGEGGPGGGGGFGGGSSHRGNVNVRLVPRDQRERTNEQIAMQLRRDLSGIPGVIIRARPSGGQQNMMRGMGGGGGDGRPASGGRRCWRNPRWLLFQSRGEKESRWVCGFDGTEDNVSVIDLSVWWHFDVNRGMSRGIPI
jgi:hypothetical protein